MRVGEEISRLWCYRNLTNADIAIGVLRPRSDGVERLPLPFNITRRTVHDVAMFTEFDIMLTSFVFVIMLLH